MRTLRWSADVLLGLLVTDVLLCLVTGGASLVSSRVSGPGLACRLGALGLLLVVRTQVLAEKDRRLGGGRLVLALLLLPTLAQFQYAGGRLKGDGVMYYVYVRSLVKDFDVDLTDEYTHYGLIGRGDLAMPTKTGLRRSIFSIGPAVVSIPFFLLGEAVARVQNLAAGPADLSGYGPAHRNAVALGGLLYGFGAVVLIHGLLRRHFPEGVALGTALLLWGATFLHWYMVEEPTMSHATSVFGAALVLTLWERGRGGRSPMGYALLGLALGLAMCLRWQNGVLLVLPGVELLLRLRQRPRPAAASALALGAGVLVGAFPQMAAWKAIYGEWVLRYPPHGADFLRLDHPFLLNTFFSSRHGLFSWTPVFWAAYLGYLPLFGRRRELASLLLVPVALMTYVNACSGDWWAGGSFSNRRFDSLIPLLAFGLAASLEAARGAVARRPGLALVAAGVPFVALNLASGHAAAEGLVPRDEAVAFPRLVGAAWRSAADVVGSPNTWPASWLFALETGRPAGQYDLLVGRYLFYRQNNLAGHVAVGEDPSGALLGEGWGACEDKDGARARRLLGRARLFAPLDVPEDLELTLTVEAPPSGAEVGVLVNGFRAGRVLAPPAWGPARLRVAAALWRRELNDVILETSAESVFVAALDAARVGALR